MYVNVVFGHVSCFGQPYINNNFSLPFKNKKELHLKTGLCTKANRTTLNAIG